MNEDGTAELAIKMIESDIETYKKIIQFLTEKIKELEIRIVSITKITTCEHSGVSFDSSGNIVN